MAAPLESFWLENVEWLNLIDCSDNVPNIQFPSAAIELDSSVSFKKQLDSSVYSSKFEAEVELLSQIEDMFEKGKQYVVMLYSFRSVSKAIPQVAVTLPDNATNEDKDLFNARKTELNKKIVEILRPEIVKLKEFMLYATSAVALFKSVIEKLASNGSGKTSLNEGIALALVNLLDILVKLDSLKDMKVSIKNDFSRYKRAVGAQQTAGGNAVPAALIEEQMQIQPFITNPDPKKASSYIFATLREEIKRVNNHEEVLAEMLNYVVFLFEKKHYVTPDEKFRLVRVMPHLLLLIDGNADQTGSRDNVFKNKVVNFSSLQRILRHHPVSPLYADMSLTVYFILERAAHFDSATMASQWGESNSDSVAKEHDMTHRWVGIKQTHDSYLTRLVPVLSKLKTFNKVVNAQNITFSEQVFSVVKEGVQLLSEWSSLVKQMMAWKYTHPVDTNVVLRAKEDENGEEGVAEKNDGLEYERVVKYNFSKTECSVLVDIISTIKSLSSLLARNESSVAPVIRFHIHHSLQQLVQVDMLPALHRSDKRPKKTPDCGFYGISLLRQLIADWEGGKEPVEDYKSYNKKTSKADASHPARLVSCSPTQLCALRVAILNITADNSEARKSYGFMGMGGSDLDSEDVSKLKAFYMDALWFKPLLTLPQTLREVSDMSDLLYREFYLDLAKCIQFPIEMSLPWILTEHVVTSTASADTTKSRMMGTSDIPMIENIVYLLDIYNDAAHRALYDLKQQFIYDEVEAEANLVFDQLIFLISDEIYTYYKNVSASITLDAELKEKLEIYRGKNYLSSNRRRYEIPLSQKHIQLLGRSIDLNFLICQHVNNKFYRDVDVIIQRYESGDICSIIDLRDLLQLVRKSHSYLSEYCQLDNFDNLMSEVNESFSPVSFKDRISIHTLRVLIMDLVPNFSYNSTTKRFVRSAVALKPMEFGKGNNKVNNLYGEVCYRAFELSHKLTRGFFGKVHIEALVEVLGCSNLTLVIDKLLCNAFDKLQDLKMYVEALHQGIPPTKMPQFLFQTVGCYGYFEGKLRGLLEYEDLKPEVFQGFRELGNTIALLFELSHVISIHDQFQFIHLAPLLNIAPGTTTGFDFTKSPVYKTLMSTVAAVNSNPTLAESVNGNFVLNSVPDMLKQFREIYSTVLEHKSLSVFVIKKLEEYLYQLDLITLWGSATAPDGSVSLSSMEFHRMWSALNYLFSTPDMVGIQEAMQAAAAAAAAKRSGKKLLEEEEVLFPIPDDCEFGDGFNLAGCLLIHLLGQRSVFDTYDFASHVINASDAETCTKSCQKEETKKNDLLNQQQKNLEEETQRFLQCAHRQKAIQEEFFAMYEALYPNKDTVMFTAHPNESFQNIVRCVPPSE